jgi:hypothetical protein
MDEILFDKKFIKVKKCKNHNYFYSERLGIDSVGFILRNNETNKYGLILERKPPLDEREKEIKNKIIKYHNNEAYLATAFGGSNDKIDILEYKKLSEEEKIKYFKKIVLNEVKEESGYQIKIDNIKFIDKAFVSTQQNQFCYLYIVDITKVKKEKPDFETEMEALSSIEWLDTVEIVKNTYDWKAKNIVLNYEIM